MVKRSPSSFVAGFVTAAVLFGGTALGVDYYQQQITVSYTPLTYFFDGAEKAPPADQKGFIYGGRTYVPLRFMGEALNKKVGYDPQTSSIYVGAKPGAVPALWQNQTKQGEAAFKLAYFEEGAQTIRGQAMPRAVVVQAVNTAGEDPSRANVTSELWVDYQLPDGAKTISGTLYVPSNYFGLQGERKIGRLTVMDENNRALYSSGDLATDATAVPFEFSVATAKKVKLVVTMYANQGLPLNQSLVAAHLGISDLQVK